MKTKTAPVHLDAKHLSDEFDKSEKTTEWTTYRCHLVTPMYGGGVRAGVVDQKQPFRATAIRGQLRQWWRWANENRFKTPEGKPDHKALFKAERELWGGLGDEKTLRASRVVVRVKAPLLPSREPNRWWSWLGEQRGKTVLQQQIILEQKDEVTLLKHKQQAEQPDFEVSWYIKKPTATDTEEVKQAFRLWATFGGVGARRRRGLGAVEVFSSDDKKDLLAVTKEDITAIRAQYLSSKDSYSTYKEAVEVGLDRLREFRQGVETGRGAGDGIRPGGSLWPEANAVRHLTHRSRDKNEIASRHPPLLFPRALLGLPIVFQFKPDEKSGDPFTTNLEPMSADGMEVMNRFSSPLIFSAQRIKKGMNDVYQPTVLLLPTHTALRTRKLHITMKDLNVPIADWWPSTGNPNTKQVAIQKRKQVLPKKLVTPAGESGDVLTAFIKFFIAAP